jgi:hypothetical protein
VNFTRRQWLGGSLALAALRPLPSVAAADKVELKGPVFDELEHRTFSYFWETTDPRTGLAPDRWPRKTQVSVAAVGFALTAYPIGVERGWVSREQAVERTLTTLRWFRNAPQGPGSRGFSGYKGFFYHWLEPDTGLRFELSELSTADTALFLLGALYCRECFDGTNAAETEVRALADELYANCDWEWARNGGKGIPYQWHPEHGHDRVNWSGYDEGMFIYILAMGSPTHAIPGSCWQEWTSTYDTKFGGWGGKYGPPHLQCAPMFGHQYTQVWMDLRGMTEPYLRRHGIDYFENTRRAALAQQAYAIANPDGWRDYGEHVWGLTACDGPANVQREYKGKLRNFYGYQGRGLVRFDDGTVSPPAVAASLPFAPEIVVPTLNQMYSRYGDLIFGKYGFVDAFNPSFDFDVDLSFGRRVPGRGWFDTDYIAIDQGPILGMFANYRNEGIWSKLRRTQWLRRGLKTAGFRGGWIE